MHEKLNFLDEPISKNETEQVKKLLLNFSKKENQSLQSFRSQFEFLDDDSIEIKNKNKTVQEKILSIINKIEIEPLPIQLTRFLDTDEIETINLDSNNRSNSFWNRNDNFKIQTKFDNFLPNEEDECIYPKDKMDDLFDLIGDNFNQYEPTLINSVKDEVSVTNEIEISKQNLALVENHEINEIELKGFEPKIIPGQISDSESSEEEYSIEKTQHLTRLDIFQHKSYVENNLDLNSSITEKETEETDNLVELFELDKNHDYNIYVHKARFNF